MSARDKYHQIVKMALAKEDWLITHDPYPLQAGNLDLAIDLGAEKVIAAEKSGHKIAVEIKSFLGPSKISEFYGALGQFITYRTALQVQENDRILYLAISSDVYDNLFMTIFIQNIIKQNDIYLVIYNLEKEEIEQWIP